MGGVLFIDEAYYLYRPENEKDYGQEAIEILLQVMENQRDDLTVILGGLHRTDATRSSRRIPGFRSRIAHHIEFPDYTDDELLLIAQKMASEAEYQLTDSAREGAEGVHRAAPPATQLRERPLAAQRLRSSAAAPGAAAGAVGKRRRRQRSRHTRKKATFALAACSPRCLDKPLIRGPAMNDGITLEQYLVQWADQDAQRARIVGVTLSAIAGCLRPRSPTSSRVGAEQGRCSAARARARPRRRAEGAGRSRERHPVHGAA